MKWIAFNPADFLTGTERLTPEQIGIYIRLLCMIYEREGPIPDDPKWLAGRLFISTRLWRKVRSELIAAGKIFETVTTGGEPGLSNPRCETELEESRRRLGKRGQFDDDSRSVRDRFEPEQKTKSNEINDDFRQQEHLHTPPNPPPGDDELEEELFLAWMAYPQRGRGSHGPRAALEIWPQAVARAGGGRALVEASRAFAKSDMAKSNRILPTFHKWLAQEGYLAHVAPPKLKLVSSQ